MQFCEFYLLAYATQVKSAFHAHWLGSLIVNGKYYSPLSSGRDKITYKKFNFPPFFGILILYLPWVTKTEFHFTISIQYQPVMRSDVNKEKYQFGDNYLIQY